MNRFQKVLNKAVKKNIKLYPDYDYGSFCKRRKLIKEVVKLFHKGVFDIEDLED